MSHAQQLHRLGLPAASQAAPQGPRGIHALALVSVGRFPHALYMERRSNGTLRIVSYVPHNPRHKRLPPPLFSGRSKWGDL